MEPGQKLVLEQRAFLKGYQRFEIRANGDLDVLYKRILVQRQFQIPLWRIIAQSERYKSRHVGSMLGAIIFGALALGTLYGIIAALRSTSDRDIAFVLGFPFIFFGVFAWIAFYRFITQSIDAAIFHLREGGQIHVWFEKPEAESFDAFCKVLARKAEDAWNYRPVDEAGTGIAGEIAALKRLNTSGVLTDAEFERAKAKLLQQAEERKIGFA